ncbi:fumarylacetoacetate hydrolase family protein [Rhodopila globiformis]|uniref:2-keto-4-pentenoate hydratase n=1 Tax=Rhodopila globiformis TaxID=1071 RepID=A0A2S6NGE6_RHOGL|nr:fumarylacetoacetate hydrolase family protein [Rhodopila globiformis]PPQ33686.1 2-keto-4-pentenoate hydratase [Rhodopila globiformis]
MRWARIERNGSPSYAVVEGDTVIPVRGSPFDAWERTPERLKRDAVKLLVPVIPPTFYAAGMNYPEHVREVAEKVGQAPNLPTRAEIGYRANNALIAHNETIVIPADATEQVQYEGELVVVIGRKCKNLTRENALSAVLGYTIGNDVSERTWQKQDRTMWRSKNTDTFKPMGPWIETNVKLDDLVTRIRLNGEPMIAFATNHMIFGVVDYLVAMTTRLTLHPGDVIWMGTEGATANIRHGDRVDIEITGIGTLSNPVVREGFDRPLG